MKALNVKKISVPRQAWESIKQQRQGLEVVSDWINSN